MREKQIEQNARRQAIASGARLIKLTGSRGIPDRLLIGTGGRVAFIEFKAPGQTPTIQQREWLRHLDQAGHIAVVVDDITDFERVLHAATS